MERIRGVFHGSTSCVSDGYGAYHSRSVVMGGSAILAAAAGRRDAIRARAAQRLGCEPTAVALLDGKAQGPAGRSIALSGLAEAAISFEGSFLNKKHTCVTVEGVETATQAAFATAHRDRSKK